MAAAPAQASIDLPPPSLTEVEVAATPLDRLFPLVGEERAARLVSAAGAARTLLGDRTVWNVNATASGGGVAEMLGTLLAYTRGAGVDSRWLVLSGEPAFFTLTKRLHNYLHGSPGDGGPLGEEQRGEYERVLAVNLEALLERVRPGDVVLLHDPQTAGLVPGLREAGARVLWRCHVGRDTPDEHTEAGWAFLRPYVEQAEATIWSRAVYAPDWVDPSTVRVIPPSLDPFSPKNLQLPEADVRATLHRSGLRADGDAGGSATFGRRDGSTGVVRRHAGLFAAGAPPRPGAKVVLQVSRWDRLKDMAGVLRAFADHVDRFRDDAHLLLVGPEVAGVGDDPEGAEVLGECCALWEEQPSAVRERIGLVALPMGDLEENAHLVNALQHDAAVVVQKSLVEGFGLTVTEPMWKGRPVVASRVGGIADQVEDGRSGLLLDDPRDLGAFASLVGELLADDQLAARLGSGARERVRTTYLGDRHLIQYVELLGELLGS
ncbi:glycosyltransferase [Nocardioides caldifontis]|uniref:glycosyltransferase n=1 Tax=Nocardioides caldifontis TaxID=2588938 RepID=UPI0011DF8B8B|nr:glycosyltransferase [Nocardioides caldifontis]